MGELCARFKGWSGADGELLGEFNFVEAGPVAIYLLSGDVEALTLVEGGELLWDFEVNELDLVAFRDFTETEHEEETTETLAVPLAVDHAPDEFGLLAALHVMIAATAEDVGVMFEDKEGERRILQKGLEGLPGMGWR